MHKVSSTSRGKEAEAETAAEAEAYGVVARGLPYAASPSLGSSHNSFHRAFFPLIIWQRWRRRRLELARTPGTSLVGT